MNFSNKLIKKHLLFFILIPIVFIIQSYSLSPHLKYGFDDTADQYISQFRQIRSESLNPLQFVKNTLQLPLLWVHEYYYVGILNYFLGNNLVEYHQVAHFFKALSAISLYSLFFILSGSSLLAFTSCLVFAISYSAAGSLEDVVVAGDYIGIIVLSIFFTIYFSFIKNKSTNLIKYISGLIFLILSLSIATTRTFPVVLIILATEIFIYIRNRSKENLKLVLKRISIFLLPILLVILLKPAPVIERVNAVSQSLDGFIFSGGMHELLLVPFLSFISTILPIRLWSYLTIVLFYFLPIILAFLLSKKPLRFILITFSTLFVGLLIINWSWLTSSSHNFVELKTKTPMAFIVLGLAFSFFIEWLKNKNRLYIGLFVGPLLSFTFIFCIWVLTQERGLFNDIHRYLTHSSIFMSFFIGSLIVVLFDRFKNGNSLLKRLSFLVFLLIPIYIVISSNQISFYFNQKFQEGYTLKDQDTMRKQLVPYLQNSTTKRLIYIDLSSEQDKLYYKEIYRYGPLFWLFWYDKTVKNDTIPHSIFDYGQLKSSVVIKDNNTGILFQGVFYKSEDFIAIKMVDKEAIDITSKTKKDLGL